MRSKTTFSPFRPRLAFNLMNARIIMAAAAVLLLLPSCPAWAADYYVSPSGSDSQSGSSSSPWRTIQHAADSVSAGDMVTVLAGTYSESVVFHISGSSESPIQFAAAGGKEVVVRGTFELARDASHISVTGFILRDFDGWGIFLRGGNADIVLSSLQISGGDCGLRLTYGYSGEDPLEGPVSNVTLKDSLVKDALYTGVDGTPGPCRGLNFINLEVMGCGLTLGSDYGADGIAVERGEDILVEGCAVHDNAGDGIDLNSRDRAGFVRGIVVRRNRVFRNRLNGIKLWSGGTIENNLVWGQGNTAVDIGAHPGIYRLANNTVAYNMWDPSFSVRSYSLAAAYPDDSSGGSASVDLTLINNIFAFNTGPQVGSPTGIYLGPGVRLRKEGWNIFWSREDGEIQAEFVNGDSWFSRSRISGGEWRLASGRGEGDLCSDPMFYSSWPDCDLRLQSSSPGIDGGTTEEAPAVDIDCMARPAGGGPDMGAHEMNSERDPQCAPGTAITKTKRISRPR